MTSNPSREALLAAAGALLGEKPWSKISLGQIAARAGVSRQTLYNEFGGRREFAQAFVLREAELLLVGPEAELTRLAHQPRAALTAALRVFLEASRTNHLLRAMRAGDEDDSLLQLVTTRGEVLATATARLDAHVQRTWPGVEPAAARRLMDILVRLAISHATLPTAAPARTAKDVVAVLGPEIDALLAGVRRAA